MAKKIEVLLLENIAGLGEAGDIVAVSEGYARNSLFPTGKAALADAAAQSTALHQREKKAAATAAALAEHQVFATRLDGTELTIVARVKPEGTDLYGRINAAMIVEELQTQAGIEVKAKDLILPEPITALGSYPVTINVADGIEAIITVVVSAADQPSNADGATS